MDGLRRILMVEDDPRDVELSLTALEQYNLANEVVVVGDGEEALDYLYAAGQVQGAREGNPPSCYWTSSCRRSTASRSCKQIRSRRR